MINTCFVATQFRDALFYTNLYKSFQGENYNILILSFCRENDLYFESHDVNFFSIYNYYELNRDKIDNISIEIAEKEFNIPSYENFCYHEKISNKNDINWLRKKGKYYLYALNDLFSKNHFDVVIQEIGGWILCQSVWYMAKKFNIQHVFMEPSPFKGKVFLWLNHWGPKIDKRPDDILNDIQVKEHWEKYLDEFQSSKDRMIPTKDLKMIHDVNFDFLFNKELINKAIYAFKRKYVVNKGFDTISPLDKVITYYFKRLINRKLNGNLYSNLNEIEKGKKIIYYPFHHPIDFQLLVRSPMFMDQLNLIKLISRYLPTDFVLYIKEHPVCVGAYSYSMIKELSKLSNVKILHPMLLTQDVLKQIDVIISVNSKVGFEGLLLNKPVITLSESFYTGWDLTIDMHNGIENLENVISDSINFKPDRNKLIHFLENIKLENYNIDLFNNEPEFIEKSKDCIKYFCENRL